MSDLVKPLTIDQVLEPLAKRQGLFISSLELIINQDGHFVCTLFDTSIKVQQGHMDFGLAVAKGYQKNFKRWLVESMQVLTQNRSAPIHLCFPISVSLTENVEELSTVQTFWVSASFSQLPSWLSQSVEQALGKSLSGKAEQARHQVDRLFKLKLTRLDSHLYQLMYQAQATTRFELKHDLANRLFLFKSLPQMAEFSEPQELLNDVLEELPNLVEFIETRLASRNMESMPFSWLTSEQSLFNRFKELGGLPLLSTLFEFEYPKAVETTQEFSPNVQGSFLGLEWSFLYLSSINKHLIKTYKITDVKRKPLHCSLSYYTGFDELAQGTQLNDYDLIYGDCGRLTPDRVRYCLKLSFEQSLELNLKQVLRDWYTFKLDPNYSLGLKRHIEKEQAWTLWLNTWFNAAHLLKGIVKILDQHTITIIF